MRISIDRDDLSWIILSYSEQLTPLLQFIYPNIAYNCHSALRGNISFPYILCFTKPYGGLQGKLVLLLLVFHFSFAILSSRAHM